MRVLLLLCLGIVVCACTSGPRPASARPPATRVEPVTDVLHGTTIVDNYRWLEGDLSNPDPRFHGTSTPEIDQ